MRNQIVSLYFYCVSVAIEHTILFIQNVNKIGGKRADN